MKKGLIILLAGLMVLALSGAALPWYFDDIGGWQDDVNISIEISKGTFSDGMVGNHYELYTRASLDGTGRIDIDGQGGNTYAEVETEILGSGFEGRGFAIQSLVGDSVAEGCPDCIPYDYQAVQWADVTATRGGEAEIKLDMDINDDYGEFAELELWAYDRDSSHDTYTFSVYMADWVTPSEVTPDPLNPTHEFGASGTNWEWFDVYGYMDAPDCDGYKFEGYFDVEGGYDQSLTEVLEF